MKKTQVRDSRSSHPSGIQTIIDDPGPLKNTEQHQKLNSLTAQVEGMAAVFEEANKAREEHRKMLEERHQDVLRRITDTRDYVEQESKRLKDTLHTFQAKFNHELAGLRSDLLSDLNNMVVQIRTTISGLEGQVTDLEEALRQEKEDRIKQTEEILGGIRKQVEQLTSGLEQERKIRQNREKELLKELSDAMDLLNTTLDTEKFNREQQYQGMKNEIDREQTRLGKRQYQIEVESTRLCTSLRDDLVEETKHRFEGQDGIVDNVSSFIKRFQDNIREEGRMG